MNEMNVNDLELVTGGEFEGPESFSDATVVLNGNLYNERDLREVVGQIQAGQKVRVNPVFRYNIAGVDYCAVEVNGATYITEWANIAL